MKKSLLLNLTGEMPLFKIIDFLLDNKGMDFSKSDISKGAGISRASLFTVTQKIIELEKTLIAEAMNKAVNERDNFRALNF